MTQKPRLKGRRMSGVHGDPRRPTKSRPMQKRRKTPGSVGATRKQMKPKTRKMNWFHGAAAKLTKLKPRPKRRKTHGSVGETRKLTRLKIKRTIWHHWQTRNWMKPPRNS